MSAKAVSESSAKSLIYAALSCECVSKNPLEVVTLDSPLGNSQKGWIKKLKLVAKPDVLIKRRGKLGLVSIDKTSRETEEWLDTMIRKEITIGSVTGKIDRFIVEPFVPHDQSEEYYVCIYTQRECNVILFHHEGGINVGDVDQKARRIEVTVSDIMQRREANQPICTPDQLLESTLLSEVVDDARRKILATFIADLHRVFDELHFTYLEINPLVVCEWCSSGSESNSPTGLYVHILDAAAKLDQCAEYLFANSSRWSPNGKPIEFPLPFGRTQTPEEAYIAQLDARTGASLKLSILNPNGRIWTMCAGGGASVIYADTVCTLAEYVKSKKGIGNGAQDLANYGEYSGAPSEGQTYEYAKTILSLMTRGEPHPEGKILLIGGGIANFTNVAATFKGVVRALTDYKAALQAHKVCIFVRRAGPNYQEGLRIMRELGASLGVPIYVFGPETHMTAIVSMAFGLREIPTIQVAETTESLLKTTTGAEICSKIQWEQASTNVCAPISVKPKKGKKKKRGKKGAGAQGDAQQEEGDAEESHGQESQEQPLNPQREGKSHDHQGQRKPPSQSAEKSHDNETREKLPDHQSDEVLLNHQSQDNRTEPLIVNGTVNGELDYHPTTYRELFTPQSRCIVWGLQVKAVQSMLDFDYASDRETPSVAALVYPFGEGRQVKVYWGSKEIFIPVYKTLREAMIGHQDARILVNFASLRVAYEVCMEAMSLDRIGAENESNTKETQIQCIAVIAEGIPENFTRCMICRAKQRNVLLIGPATVGGVKPGCFKIGNTGGMVDNIFASRLYRPGSVAYVSRSGGMSNELNNIVSLNSDGVEEGVAIGGDRYPGSTFLDYVLRFEQNPNVCMIVLLGEIGGIEEYKVVEAVRSGRVRKPIVAWCIGTCAQLLAKHSGGVAEGVQFGHAGACANSLQETAVAKNAAMAAVGIHVPSSFDELDSTIRKVFDELVRSGKVVPKPTGKPRPVPIDYSWAKELGLIRRPAAFTSTICDDRGAELLFAGVPISQVISENMGIGGVLGLLWFKRRLPDYFVKYLELCLVITADHGPAVSGALNTIVTARAGKDLLSSLTSGLLTIGDRFGGALDGAARQFSAAFDAGLSPADFVANERRANRLIMGIGHRIKSITNPDERVQLLSQYVHANFPATPLVDYAFAVEKVTTSKRPNLILNVDGMIGVSMVDLLRNCGYFTREEADEYVAIGTLNALFVLGRSIGFIGHYLDQRRLHQGLYRHPWEDISYMLPEAGHSNGTSS
ncbi:unnamed protein product [Calicophoron daubneyi]|uniref:ATP citrate synthase n=1 Tax=Calicophoron daubneyi TaxID=300641 RepID=A0AAV2T9A6_CALDB